MIQFNKIQHYDPNTDSKILSILSIYRKMIRKRIKCHQLTNVYCTGRILNKIFPCFQLGSFQIDFKFDKTISKYEGAFLPAITHTEKDPIERTTIQKDSFLIERKPRLQNVTSTGFQSQQ